MARAQALPSGDPATPGTIIGPLITPAARDRVAREVDEAVADGARVLTGDNQRGFALTRRIDAGAVHVNDQTIADEPRHRPTFPSGDAGRFVFLSPFGALT